MSVLLLGDAKAHLNITQTTNDGEIQQVIDAAEAAISARIGPLAATAVTRRVPGRVWSLLLPTAPVVSLTSVKTSDGVAVDTALLRFEQDAGTVQYLSGALFSAVAYDVSYKHGYSTVPADLLFAIKEQVRHMWTTQRGPNAAANRGSGQQGEGQQGAGFMMPNRVLELLQPYRVPGVA